MVQTLNFISLSSQQAPNDVDWAGLVKAGVQGALIRLGHGIIRDPCASGHIAKAKQYGLYWHGYHTYEGVVNEPQFTIKNATELGLSNSQYYFVDLTKSSDPFNDYYALHATWLSQGYSTGLLISNEDYLSKFKDSEVIASGTLRWLISDTEPADYDVWQYSSEGTVGTSSVKVGFNFSKTDKLKYNLDTTLTGADINKDPYNPETPVGGAYIGWGYDTTGLGGGKTIGYSTDGKNFYALIGPDGLIVRKSDGNRIYGTISDQIDSAISANVIPAKSAADSAVSAADAAVESAQVTSDAVTAIASATAEAKQGANEAMSRAKSAWDVATGAKEAVTDFDPLLKSAQSDASKALTQIADTASALSDAKTAFNSDVAAAKELASTAQTTADNAVKSASSVADDLTTVASQAKANGGYISKLQSDVNVVKSTLATQTGDVSQLQQTATKLQSDVTNAQGSITELKQTASDIKQTVSDLSVGGYNYFTNSAFTQFTTSDYSGVTSIGKIKDWSQYGGTFVDVTPIKTSTGSTTVYLLGFAGSYVNIGQTIDFSNIPVFSGDKGFFSFYYNGAFSSVNIYISGVGIDQTTVIKDQNSNGLLSRVVIPVTFPKSFTGKQPFTVTIVGTSAGIKLTMIMFEKATISSDWQPNPADNETAVNSLTTIVNQTKTDITAVASKVTNNESDISKLKVTADSIKATVSSNQTDISTLQQTAKGLTVDVSGLQSDVDAVTKNSDANKSSIATLTTSLDQTKSDITLTAIKADSATSTANNAKAEADSAVTSVAQIKVTADGAVTTATNAQSDATQAKVTATSTQTIAKNAASDAVVATQTAIEAKTVATNAKSDVSVISQTATSLSQRVSGVENSIKTQTLSDSQQDLNNLTTTGIYSIHRTDTSNAPDTSYCLVTVRNDSDGRIYQTWQSDNDPEKRYYRVNNGVWSAWAKTTTQSDISSLNNTITTAQTQINQNKNAIALKADQTTVDTLSGKVSQNTATLTTQANLISSKVTSSDVQSLLNSGGYATQTYTQSLVTLKADEWNLNLTKLKNDTQTSVTNLSATVDGIKSTVANKADQSTVTQLSNAIQSKVDSSTYTSAINQLSSDINLRVKSADLISQINLQAGTALIQSNKLVLDVNTTVFTGDAFIPSAAISSISADKIMLGSSSLWNSDGTFNLVNQSNGLKALIQVKQGLVQDTTQSIISFSSDYNNRAFSVTPVGATITPTLFFERYDQTEGHWLGFTRNEVRRDGLMFNTWDNDGERFFVACHARFDRSISATGNIYQGSWNGTTGKPLAGILSIESGNTIWSGSDYLAIGDHLSNSFTNVMARSFSQQSTLSSKTNIETVDPKDALDLVNRTDIRSYQYKTDVAEGKAKRYTSLIIDDVNDVSKYYAPDEFTNEERTGRDDGSAVGYLFLAIQELTRRIKTLEEKLNG